MKKKKNPTSTVHYFNCIFLASYRPFLWIIIAGFLIFGKTVSFLYVYFDDNVFILNHAHFITHSSSLLKSFTTDIFQQYDTFYYRPIFSVSLVLNGLIGGTSPAVFHLSNVLLHCICGCLVLVLLKKLSVPPLPSFILAILFTILPVQSQAVAWIPGRNDTLLGVFIFSTFIFFVTYIKSGRVLHLVLSILFFGPALFSKETAVAVMLLAPLFCALESDYRNKKTISRMIFCEAGWGALFILWFLLRSKFLTDHYTVTIHDSALSVLQGMPVIIQYLGKIFFPFNLSVLPLLADTTYRFGIIALILLILLIYRSPQKNTGFLIFGSAWFLLFLLPSFLSIDPQNLVAYYREDRLYVPVVGILIFLAGLSRPFSRHQQKRMFYTGIGTVIFIFALITFAHLDAFKNRYTFWQQAIKTSPHAALAHKNYGSILHHDNRLDEAFVQYDIALKLNPKEIIAHYNKGLIYLMRNRFDKARLELEEELKINPNYDEANFTMGSVCFNNKEYDKAEFYWQKTLKVNPRYKDAYSNLAILYLNQGDTTSAMQYLEYYKNPAGRRKR